MEATKVPSVVEVFVRRLAERVQGATVAYDADGLSRSKVAEGLLRDATAALPDCGLKRLLIEHSKNASVILTNGLLAKHKRKKSISEEDVAVKKRPKRPIPVAKAIHSSGEQLTLPELTVLAQGSNGLIIDILLHPGVISITSLQEHVRSLYEQSRTFLIRIPEEKSTIVQNQQISLTTAIRRHVCETESFLELIVFKVVDMRERGVLGEQGVPANGNDDFEGVMAAMLGACTALQCYLLVESKKLEYEDIFGIWKALASKVASLQRNVVYGLHWVHVVQRAIHAIGIAALEHTTTWKTFLQLMCTKISVKSLDHENDILGYIELIGIARQCRGQGIVLPGERRKECQRFVEGVLQAPCPQGLKKWLASLRGEWNPYDHNSNIIDLSFVPELADRSDVWRNVGRRNGREGFKMSRLVDPTILNEEEFESVKKQISQAFAEQDIVDSYRGQKSWGSDPLFVVDCEGEMHARKRKKDV